MLSRFGYSGQVLEVDLSSGKLGVSAPSEEEWRTYVGGGLMGVRRLLVATEPGLDAYDPSALLMFWSSVIAGHPFVGLARFVVVAKSPLTGGIGEARVEGPFGISLKASGYEGLVFNGKANEPMYLLIDGGVPSLLDASELWGRNTADTTDFLQERHGPTAHIATIGPAGEKLVRFASIISDRTHPATRMGLGAVMGAKKLKAVVIINGSSPDCAEPESLTEITMDCRRRIRKNPLTESQSSSPGFAAWFTQGDAIGGYAGVFNYQSNSLPSLEAVTPEELRGRMRKCNDNCPGCPNDCIKVFTNNVDDRAGGLDQETLAAFALGLGITSVDVLLDLNASCHLWGVDPVSLASTCAFVCELGAKGLVVPNQLGGTVPEFGDEGRLVEFLEDVALRRPGVEWLSEGVHRAAQRLAVEAQDCAMVIKGLEMMSFDPRASGGQALAYAVSPLGPRYDIVEHDIDFDPVDGYSHGLDQLRSLGFAEWAAMDELDSSRVARTRILLDMWSGLDALCMCLFAGPPLRELTLLDVARIVRAVTGWETSFDEIFVWGRRRWQLMRVYNLREGLRATDDCLPRRFHRESIDAGRHSGVILDEQNFRERVEEYYDLVGWDGQGVPKAETLVALSLEWAIGN